MTADPDFRGRIAQLENRLDAAERLTVRLRAILDCVSQHAFFIEDSVGRVTAWSNGAKTLTGYAEAEILGRSAAILLTEDDTSISQYASFGLSSAPFCRWLMRKDGSRFRVSCRAMRWPEGGGESQSIAIIFCDGTDVDSALERRDLLVEEMVHRLKNTYALVQAIATQTGHYAATIEGFVTVFTGRLQALARAHNELIRAGSQDMLLSQVVEGTLAAFRGEGKRITVDGPAVMLGSSLVTAVSLALHELATNAIKHGALSLLDGWVTVAWSLDRQVESRVQLDWLECGGPPVRPPATFGFGSRLLRRGMPSSIKVALEFDPAGLACRISMPSALPHGGEVQE